MLGNYVTPGARPDAPRAALVRRARPTPIFQNLNLVYDEQPDYICVFGADHIYRMDPRQMVDAAHRDGRGRDRGRRSACRSTQAEPVRRHRARRRWRAIRAFREKPPDAAGLPDAPDAGAGLDGQLRVHRRRR